MCDWNWNIQYVDFSTQYNLLLFISKVLQFGYGTFPAWTILYARLKFTNQKEKSESTFCDLYDSLALLYNYFKFLTALWK